MILFCGWKCQRQYSVVPQNPKNVHFSTEIFAKFLTNVAALQMATIIINLGSMHGRNSFTFELEYVSIISLKITLRYNIIAAIFGGLRKNALPALAWSLPERKRSTRQLFPYRVCKESCLWWSAMNFYTIYYEISFKRKRTQLWNYLHVFL